MAAPFRWESGFNHQLVLGKIEDCRNIGKDGRVSFSSDDYGFWLPVLESAIRVPESVRHLKHRCIADALNDTSLTLKDCDAFLQSCEVAYDRLSARPKSEFVVVMSMTYSGSPLFARMIDGDVIIQWQQSPRSKFMRAIRKSRKEQKKVRENHNVPEETNNLSNVLVRVSAYDPYHAHEIASDSMDSLRAILNMFVNSNRSLNHFGSGGRPHAVNMFRPGPYRTVHKPDGSLATETFWYEHRWLHETRSAKFKDVEEFRENLQLWWSRLQKNPLNAHIKQGLLRYCRALDLHDAEPALLEMWGALESLTGTQREKYDVTVDRTARLFKDRDDARQIVQHVRLRRNSTIHAARTLRPQEADAILIHAETVVSRVIFFCLAEGRRFRDPSDLFEFLDLALDKNRLKRQVALSKFFLQYQDRHLQRS